MEGYLYKSTSYFSTWKKRYFVLKDNIFYYYKEKGGELKGRIHLSISFIKNNEENDKRFELDSGLVSISLRAETPKDRDIWINKINKHKLDYERYEKEHLYRNSAIFHSEAGTKEEIEKLESKLDVIRKYTGILSNYNDKIFELTIKKNCEEQILQITKENKVIYALFII